MRWISLWSSCAVWVGKYLMASGGSGNGSGWEVGVGEKSGCGKGNATLRSTASHALPFTCAVPLSFSFTLPISFCLTVCRPCPTPNGCGTRFIQFICHFPFQFVSGRQLHNMALAMGMPVSAVSAFSIRFSLALPTEPLLSPLLSPLLLT